MKSSRRSDPPGVGANGVSPLLLHALTIRVCANASATIEIRMRAVEWRVTSKVPVELVMGRSFEGASSIRNRTKWTRPTPHSIESAAAGTSLNTGGR